MTLLEDLVQYGVDSLYPKLMWQDKILIMDLLVRMQPAYWHRYMDKFAIDFILTNYVNILADINLEQLI